MLALGAPLITACTPFTLINTNPLGNRSFNSGMEKYEQGNYQGGIADYSNAIAIDPQISSAYVHRGIVRELVNELEGTCRDWRKAADFGDERPAGWVKKQC